MKFHLDQLQSSQDKTKVQIDQVQKSQDDTKLQLTHLTSRVTNLKKEIEGTVKVVVQQEVETQLKTRLPDLETRLQDQIKAISIDQGPCKDQSTTNVISDLVAKAMSEERDKEKRRPNLMVFNVPEIVSKVREERIKHDRQMVISILNHVMDVPNIEEKVVKVLRMGRWEQGKDKRPIKVVFSEPDIKFKFLLKAYKLRESEDEFMNTIQIGSDRTPQEVERRRKLKAELDTRKERGEEHWRIRKGKLVWISKDIEQPRTEPRVDLDPASGINREGDVSSSDSSDKEEALSEDGQKEPVKSSGDIPILGSHFRRADNTTRDKLANDEGTKQKVVFSMSPVSGHRRNSGLISERFQTNSGKPPEGATQCF